MTPEEESALRAENAALLARVQELEGRLSSALKDRHNSSKSPSGDSPQARVRKKAKFIYLGYMLGFMTFMLVGLFGLAFLGGEPVQTLSSAIAVVLLMTVLGTVIGFVTIDHMSFPEAG